MIRAPDRRSSPFLITCTISVSDPLAPGFRMAMTHPHAGATYRTVPLNGTFGVEIVIPGTYPTTMSSFRTAAKAGEWIARHKSFVELNTPFDRVWRRKSGVTHG